MEAEIQFSIPSSDQNSLLRNKLQLYLIKKLKSSKNSPDELSQLISFVLSLFEISSNNELNVEFSEFSMQSIRSEFSKYFYPKILNEILNIIFSNNISSSHYIASQLVKLISLTNFSDTFSLLYDFCVAQSAEIYFYLIKNFISLHLIGKMISERSENNSPRGNCSLIEDSVVLNICSLPDKFIGIIEPKVAFKNKKHHSSFFAPNNFFQIVIADLYLFLKQNYLNINENGIRLIASLYGKISFLGFSQLLFENFTKNLLILSHKQNEWRSISKRLYENIPYKYLESCLLSLLKNSSSYEDILIMIEDLGIQNPNLKHLICDKFLFYKSIKENKFVFNLIGYVRFVQESREIYNEIFSKLLVAWSSYTSFTNTSYDQHLFLTKCVLISYSFLDENDRKIFTQKLLKSLLSGVEKHLHSAFENVRVLGMVVGEVLMKGLFIDMETNEANQHLKFEYESTDETQSLIALSQNQIQGSIYKNDKICLVESNLNSIEEQVLMSEKNKEKIIFENKKLNINIKQSETFDSDDEDKLEAFDLSNDTVKKNVKKPLFLRDCLNSLIYSDEPAEIDAALKSVKSLCDTYHSELEEICVEMVRVLLCKSNSYSSKEFDSDRMTAMISVTCHYPKECASYLTHQFYEAGYSLSQRGDILNILVMAAQQLSDPNIDKIIDKRAISKNYINFNMIADDHFRDLVKKRTSNSNQIKKKKKFKSKENKFSDFVGFFFFPLLNQYDKERIYFSLIEKDYVLLGKMIFSLAMILYFSENSIVHENMIKALGDFLWSVKNHKEEFIKKSIIFAYTVIIMTAPDHVIFGYFTRYLNELKYWLEAIIIQDSNKERKIEAHNCLNLISNRAKNNLKFLING